MIEKKLLFLIVLTTLLIIPIAKSPAYPYGDVQVIENEDVTINVEVKNTGTQPQDYWVVGVNFYKVSDYINVPDYSQVYSDKDTVFAAFDASGERSANPYICRLVNQGGIPVDGCDCDGDPSRLEPGETRTVTCYIPASYFGPTTGNERIMFWIHERDTKQDAGGNGDLGDWWWYDALSRKDPAPVRVKIAESPTIDVENLNTHCGSTDFEIVVKNTVNWKSLKVNIRDELWKDTDGFETTTDDRSKVDEKTETHTLQPGETYRIPWTSYVTEKGPFYFHKLTLSSSEYGDFDIKPFWKSFWCYNPATDVNLHVDVEFNGPDRPADQEVFITIWQGTKRIYQIHATEADFNLSAGKTYKIEVKSPEWHRYGEKSGWRYFSHFWDHDCDSNDHSLDTDDNPYTFTMFNKNREITAFYKSFVDIDFTGYTGSSLKGTLRTESGSTLSSQGWQALVCGSPSTIVDINKDVTIYYEKDGDWNYIEEADGSTGVWSIDWECDPEATGLKMIYTPIEWYYMPEVREIPDFSCGLDIFKVEVCDSNDLNRCCYKNCEHGICGPIQDPVQCPNFECNDDIIVNVHVKNQDKISYNAKVAVEYWDVNEADGSRKKGKRHEQTVTIPAETPHKFNFSNPALDFANMEEGHHLGFWIYLSAGGTKFLSITDDKLDKDGQPAPPPRIDNSRIYSVECCPHLNFTCDSIAKVNGVVTCKQSYTHDMGKPGRVHFHFDNLKADFISIQGCRSVPHDWKIKGGIGDDGRGYNFEVVECDVNSGDTVTLEIKPTVTGTLKVYNRVRDLTKDQHCSNAKTWCEYSRDPVFEVCNDECEYIDFGYPYDAHLAICDSEVASIAVEEERPDLVINDIFPSDSVGITYEVMNRGGGIAFSSYSNLSVEGYYITHHHDPPLTPGDIEQYTFPTDWKWVCSHLGASDIDVEVCADYKEEVFESNEDNNCRIETWTCPKPDLVVESTEITYSDSNVQISANVRNKGDWGTSDPFTCELKADTVITRTATTGPLPAGGFGTCVFSSFEFPLDESYKVKITADSGNIIDESNEYNNELIQEIPCKKSEVPLKPDLEIIDVNYTDSLIYYTIKNTGEGSAGQSNTALFVDGQLKIKDLAPALNPGAYDTDDFTGYTWVCTDEKDVVRVYADYDEWVDESDEDNNYMEVAFECEYVGPEICYDGIDNDHDGDVDCADPYCWGHEGPGGVTCCGSETHCTDANLNDICSYSGYRETDRIGGGSCSAVDWYCDTDYVCKNTTSSGTDYCGGTGEPGDNPNVTLYECVDSDANLVEDTCVVEGTESRLDSCTGAGSSCSAIDWNCDDGLLYSVSTIGWVDKCSADYHSTNHSVCGSNDGGSVDDTCKEDIVDCGSTDTSCYCVDGSCNDCTTQGKVCEYYQCVAKSNCPDKCFETTGWEPYKGRCAATCENYEVDLYWLYGGSDPSNCPDLNPGDHCCCLYPCDMTPTAEHCALDGCNYADNCGYDALGISDAVPLKDTLTSRPPDNFYPEFDHEMFYVWCSDQRIITVTMIPEAGSDYDLYVKWETSGSDLPSPGNSDCPITHGGEGEQEVCDSRDYASILTPDTYTNIAVYNISGNGHYSLSVDCGNPGSPPPTLGIKEVGVGIIVTTTTTSTTTVPTISEVTTTIPLATTTTLATTTIPPTTTTIPSRRFVLMDLINALRQFFGRYFR